MKINVRNNVESNIYFNEIQYKTNIKKYHQSWIRQTSRRKEAPREDITISDPFVTNSGLLL